MAFGGGHTWRVNEIFSNSDGTIQFVELKECCGLPNEVNTSGKRVESSSTGSQFTLTQNQAPGSTANLHILLGTAGFAALSGAPTPDYILNDNFIGLDSDTINLFPNGSADISFGSGELPLDGVLSLHDDGTGFLVLANSPTNTAGVSGSIDAGGGGPTPTPTISFELGSSTTSESSGVASMNLVVGGLGSGVSTTETIMVTWGDAMTGTAASGVDYGAVSMQTVLIAIGASDGTTVPLQLTILQDAEVESAETVVLQIMSVSGGGSSIGAISEHIVTILDDDTPASGGEFQRGDINQDGMVDIADPVQGLAAQFQGLLTTCMLAEDVNDDGVVNIADPIYQLTNLFSMGPNPNAPFRVCGLDPTPDSLTCVSHAQCP